MHVTITFSLLQLATWQLANVSVIFSEFFIVSPFVLQIHLHLKLYNTMYTILNELPSGRPSVCITKCITMTASSIGSCLTSPNQEVAAVS
jgi:hypothetical protein